MSTINVKPQGTPSTELLGAGAIYVGGDITDWSTSPGVLLGITKGGSSFSDNAEFRKREADADYMSVKGATDMIKMNPQLTVNTLAISTANLETCFGGMVTTTDTTYETVTRTFDMSESYVDRIYWIGQTRAGKDIAIQLDDVLGDAPLAWSPAKDEEIIINTVFTAHADPATFDVADKTTYPYNIIFEK